MNSLEARPRFLITVDTEGDYIGNKSHNTKTENSKFLPRFQKLCETFGFKPTYLVNYEMTKCPIFQEFAKDILARKKAEIGMHLHPWNSPPIVPLTKNDHHYRPFLTEYPEDLIRRKIAFLTSLLEKKFRTKMLSHRAGRWAFNETYARILAEEGYKIDCSVTPHISWKHTFGHPKKDGGMNYHEFPDSAYFLNLENISQEGSSPLLEIPVTVIQQSRKPLLPKFWNLLELFPKVCRWANSLVGLKLVNSLFGQKLNKEIFPPYYMLRANGQNLKDLLWIVRKALHEERDFILLVIHSQELMPNGSLKFPNKKAVEKLYKDLEFFFDYVYQNFEGNTLQEYYNIILNNRKN